MKFIIVHDLWLTCSYICSLFQFMYFYLVLDCTIGIFLCNCIYASLRMSMYACMVAEAIEDPNMP